MIADRRAPHGFQTDNTRRRVARVGYEGCAQHTRMARERAGRHTQPVGTLGSTNDAGGERMAHPAQWMGGGGCQRRVEVGNRGRHQRERLDPVRGGHDATLTVVDDDPVAGLVNGEPLLQRHRVVQSHRGRAAERAGDRAAGESAVGRIARSVAAAIEPYGRGRAHESDGRQHRGRSECPIDCLRCPFVPGRAGLNERRIRAVRATRGRAATRRVPRRPPA